MKFSFVRQLNFFIVIFFAFISQTIVNHFRHDFRVSRFFVQNILNRNENEQKSSQK